MNEDTKAVLRELWSKPEVERPFPVPFVSWDTYLQAKYVT